MSSIPPPPAQPPARVVFSRDTCPSVAQTRRGLLHLYPVSRGACVLTSHPRGASLPPTALYSRPGTRPWATVATGGSRMYHPPRVHVRRYRIGPTPVRGAVPHGCGRRPRSWVATRRRRRCGLDVARPCDALRRTWRRAGLRRAGQPDRAGEEQQPQMRGGVAEGRTYARQGVARGTEVLIALFHTRMELSVSTTQSQYARGADSARPPPD